MTPAAVLQKIGHRVESRLDRAFAERRNAQLNAWFAADRDGWLTRLDSALAQGARWFDAHQDLTMSAILVIDQAHRQTGNPNLAFVEDRIDIYQSKYWDPGLRAVRPDYDPDAHRHLPDIMDQRPYQVIELMMIDAANADIAGPSVSLLRYLRALSDGGGYGSTHIIVAGLLMKRAGVEDPEIDRMIGAEVDAVARRNRAVSFAGDLFAERIFVLEWLNRHDLVPPAWMMRLIAAQRPDGGWRGRGVPPVGQSNQHTTSLAIAALAQFIWQERQA